MSVQALGALLGAPVELEDGPYLVLLSIANHADPDGANAWPSLATIGREANRHPRTVRRIVHELEAAGVLEVGRQRGGHLDTRSDRRPNLYRILWPALGITPPRGDTTRPPATHNGRTRSALRGDTAVPPERPLERKQESARRSVDNRPGRLREYRAGVGFVP